MTIASTNSSELAYIINRLDRLENRELETLNTLELDNGIPYVTVRNSKLKLSRFLLRRLAKINQTRLDVGQTPFTEQQILDLVSGIQTLEFETFETTSVVSDYYSSFRTARLSAMGYLNSIGQCEAGYYRLFSRFPLGSCMVDKPSGDLYNEPHNVDKILGLYDAINDSETIAYRCGIKYRVTVSSLSGYQIGIPKIELDVNSNPLSKLPLFRCLVWTLEPIENDNPTLRLLDKVYLTNSGLLADLKSYLVENNGITHIRQHNHLTDSGDGDGVAFNSNVDGLSTIHSLEFRVSGYCVDRYFPYVDSFKYVEDNGDGVTLSNIPTEETTHACESTSGGLYDYESARRCDHCSGSVCEHDGYWSERLDSLLCDTCYCELILHCDHCSSELSTHDDRAYRLPDGSISCDCCTEEL